MTGVARLGLTGGIGSGKSTVAQLLATRGASVVDADAIARQVTAPGGKAMPAIAIAFGNEFVTDSGALDRDKMRSLAYTDATARKRLEAIVHPLVGLETQRQAEAAIHNGCPCVVFDVPLLVESPTWRQKVDYVLVVDCTKDVQVQRVMARNQLTRDDILKIIASQARREVRLAAADTILFNVGLTLDKLADEVRQISDRFGLSSK
jgi:dephospho-CoA kinase